MINVPGSEIKKESDMQFGSPDNTPKSADYRDGYEQALRDVKGRLETAYKLSLASTWTEEGKKDIQQFYGGHISQAINTMRAPR